MSADPFVIDAYTHWAAPELLDYLDRAGGQKGPYNAFYGKNPLFHDVGRRLEYMDEFHVQTSILAPTPWIESAPEVARDPAKFTEAARISNDAQAKVAGVAPDRLLSLAWLPSFSGEAMVAELDRAVNQLGMVGCELPVGPTVKRMDHPDMEVLYAYAERIDVPIWMHPSRPITHADYADETQSKYNDWQALGWLHDTSSAMTRIVMSGVFDRYPALKIIAHHAGAMIPQFAGRMQACWNDFEGSGVSLGASVSKPYIEHFKKFYIDTAIFAHDPALLHHAWEFFGPERTLFGTDTPYEPSPGAFITATRSSVEAMPISDEHKSLIYTGNVTQLLKRRS